MNSIRDRRSLIYQPVTNVDSGADETMPELTEDKKKRYKRVMRYNRRRGVASYLVFLLFVLGIPLILVIYFTPFFVFQQLRCRARDKLLWSDATVQAMEKAYTHYFWRPPLYLSDAYNVSSFWGTYEPSRIFAMKSRSTQPVIVAIAWYDADGAFLLRHVMPFTHNKVKAPRTTQKPGADPEVMKIRWLVHDGIHYGKQIIVDTANNLQMEVEFLKNPSGNAWHVRIHAQLESRIHFVVYVANANADAAEALRVEPPNANNNGDWSPVLKGRLLNHGHEKESFKLRVYDDQSILHDTAPWRIYGLQRNLDESFAFVAADTVGGTPDERAKTAGRGILSGHDPRKLQEQNIDLRNLSHSAFTYIETTDPHSFRRPNSGLGQNSSVHNLIVLKKFYNANFRLELSLSPLDTVSIPPPVAKNVPTGGLPQSLPPRSSPTYEDLTTCQLSNTFRRREKAIKKFMWKIYRNRIKGFKVTRELYQRLLMQILSESFGSLSFSTGRYLEIEKSIDEMQDQRGVSQFSWSDELLKPSVHEASAVAAVGSRTDEAFGQQYLTGLQLLFLVRWNKEVVKDILASWLVGAQNPHTGFIPNRAGFTASIRSLMPANMRYEHPTFGSPPTILLGLQELLNEIEHKEHRIKHANKNKERNTPEYYKQERDADRRFLSEILPALKKWRSWWHTTQCGGITKSVAQNCTNRRPLEQWPQGVTGNARDLLVYRWRSRDGDVLPASGMSDYPRSFCTGEHYLEAHLDLFCWVALLSNLISRIEVVHLGLPASVNIDWEAHLAAVHWDSSRNRYADRVGCAKQEFSPYTGYVNLFPVILGVIRQDPHKIQATIEIAQNDLWTDYGLMAVSFDSVRHAREKGLRHQNVWMGYVWPSVNLMFLHALKSVYLNAIIDSRVRSQARNLYIQLRLTIAETIRNGGRWWEFFSPVDGRGEGSKTYIGTQALLLGILDDFPSD